MRPFLLSLLPCILLAQTLPVGPAHVQSFQATASSVRRGGTVTLRWSVTGTEQVRLDPLGLILPARGEITHLVTDRTIYWLHVKNAAGGQSAPLVVDVLPEPSGPVPAAPALGVPSPVAPGPLSQEPLRLAALPAMPQAVAALPVPAAPRLRHGKVRPVWIQFAAMVSPRSASRLQRTLLRHATDSVIQARARRAGRPYQLVRTGPFASVEEAGRRLQELAPAMKALGLRPILIQGPAQAAAPRLLLVADTRAGK